MRIIEPVEQPTPTTLPSLAPPMETKWQNTRLNVASEAVIVTEGPAPLLYLTQAPGVFRVVDKTTGEALAEMFAKGRTIIRVDERNGVVFGTETLVKGPRPKGHRYAFYLQPDPTNVARQGVMKPKAKK